MLRMSTLGLLLRWTVQDKQKRTLLIFLRNNAILNNTKWDVEAKNEAPFFFTGNDPLITFTELASVSRGLGFLNIQPDRDGVFRRMPLLVKYGDAFYPSLPFRVICDYLNVSPDNIFVDPGKHIILKKSQEKNNQENDNVIIPIDKYGNLTVNFIGPWEAFNHYNFSDILKASDDENDMELWSEELSEKIVIISEITTGSSDIGPVPTDTSYPLSGIISNVMNSIITKSFLKEISYLQMILIEIFIIFLIIILSIRTSYTFFTYIYLIIIFSYFVISALFFLYGGIVLNIVRPVLMLFIAFISIQILRIIESARIIRETEKAKYLAEHELEIGHQIQSGFFPESLPDPAGWEIAAHFKPARQVAGDFYDVFPLQDGKRVGFVIADICDKGVGAALFYGPDSKSYPGYFNAEYQYLHR